MTDHSSGPWRHQPRRRRWTLDSALFWFGVVLLVMSIGFSLQLSWQRFVASTDAMEASQ